MFDVAGRRRKAITMVNVLKDSINEPLANLTLLNVGGSAGIIDEHLSKYFNQVTGIDIDQEAIEYATQNFIKPNLKFELADAMHMKYESDSFDVVICSQVYEHVPDAKTLMSEIFRVLKPNGVVYFAAGNRLMIKEPHYNLLFLSLLPRSLSHIYLKLRGKGDYYYEKHFTYWGLKKLVRNFELVDYTTSLISDPNKFGTQYMVETGSIKQKAALFIAKYFFWLLPGYIWILKKPMHS